MTFIGYCSLRRIQKCVLYVWGGGDGLYFDTFHIVYYSGKFFWFFLCEGFVFVVVVVVLFWLQQTLLCTKEIGR